LAKREVYRRGEHIVAEFDRAKRGESRQILLAAVVPWSIGLEGEGVKRGGEKRKDVAVVDSPFEVVDEMKV
jgi:hypothetical protein